MPDLYSSIGQNARKTQPSSELGTPRLTPIIISNLEDTEGGGVSWDSTETPLGAASAQHKVVQALQQYVEVYQIGDNRGDSSLFTVICRDSSIPYDAGTTFANVGSTITDLQDAVRAIGVDATNSFENCTVVVGLLSDDDTDNGF